MKIVKPVRLQRKRKKGFRLKSPNGLPIVYVGRPTPWGNPFEVKTCGREEALQRFLLPLHGYFGWVIGKFGSEPLLEWLAPLKGKNLYKFMIALICCPICHSPLIQHDDEVCELFKKSLAALSKTGGEK